MTRNEPLLRLVCIIHILFWVYLIFGSFISKGHARFILLWLIPGLYILHMYRIHVLMTIEKSLIGPDTTPDDITRVMCDDFPIMCPFFELQRFLETNCFQSPLTGQGMMILGAIISSRILLK
jgi:hypothetical protein